MDSGKALNEFLERAGKLLVVGSRRDEFINVLKSSGILVDSELRLQSSNITQDQLKSLFEALNALAVLKITAKRVFRENGLNF